MQLIVVGYFGIVTAVEAEVLSGPEVGIFLLYWIKRRSEWDYFTHQSVQLQK